MNADDFGLSVGVNAGIIQAHRRGILTSTTLLANSPAFEEAVFLARENPGLGVGAHLNLVRGVPLSDAATVPELVDGTGRFHPFRLRKLSESFLGQAEGEYRRQIEKILAAGIVPTHIDFEKHHAWQGGLYRLACRLAAEYGIGAARILREPVVWAVRNLGWPGWSRVAMACLLRGGAQLTGGAVPVRRPDRFLGQSHIGVMDEGVWVRLLDRLPAGLSEVMTHPGLGDGGGMGGSWMGRAREVELAALVSGRVLAGVRSAGIELLHFGQIPQTFHAEGGQAIHQR